MKIKVNKSYFLEKLEHLLKTDSPSGYTHHMMATLSEWVDALGYAYTFNQKGGMIITIEGKDPSKTVALSAHVDTLGAMVRSITAEGFLKFTLVGGPIVPTLDSEYCRVHTRDGDVYTGTFLSNAPAAHVFKEASTLSRTPENMIVRLDERVRSKEDAAALGIQAGDFICIDPKTTIVNDFVKSRFIDDKGSVACILGVMEYLSANHIKPTYTTKVLISNYEEVGHGASQIPSDVVEMLAVDMGCIGDDLSCTEFDVSICAKDTSGPYDYNLVSELIQLAKSVELSYAVDIYPYYGSDVSAALKAGNDIRGALIGPGVHASHGMERTHYEALHHTMQLIYLYLTR
ncbi:M42 family metallopeptidase [Fusibacter paucivorans]|uniref:M42 family metallopeptidase n=1 Tax=Fusibacter paucivorans TaxID=76009 RepID=A0ABS5PLR1_9FIRM|nr:M42 family metallopeptidase [Fusibacter paucivorans]MBS7526104.1 M42 family metallopeptidase [Fusibacter paucivorans]